MSVIHGSSAVQFERYLHEDKHALLVVIANQDGPAGADIRARLQRARIRIARFSESYVNDGERKRTIRCDVTWRAIRQDTEVPAAIKDLAEAGGVLQLRWRA